jgi:ABC-type multidrug transport system fused ATPase/permease subunit
LDALDAPEAAPVRISSQERLFSLAYAGTSLLVGTYEGVVLQLAIIALTLAACAAYMFRTDWRLTLACLSVLPFQIWFAIRFSRKVRPAYEENRELMDRIEKGGKCPAVPAALLQAPASGVPLDALLQV